MRSAVGQPNMSRSAVGVDKPNMGKLNPLILRDNETQTAEQRSQPPFQPRGYPVRGRSQGPTAEGRNQRDYSIQMTEPLGPRPAPQPISR